MKPNPAVVFGESRWRLLALLTLAMVISFADRTVLAMLTAPIKAEMQVSDTLLGVLTGFAFSAFYATFGLLAARLADRGYHKWVIIVSLISWSLMTALCGATKAFWQLLIARFGVGAGEAGLVPAAQSVLSAAFAQNRRSTVLSILMAGGPLGVLLAFLVTARIEAAVGWRMTFVVMGIPGLLLAAAFAIQRFPRSHITARTESGPALDTHLRAIGQLLADGQFRWLFSTVVSSASSLSALRSGCLSILSVPFPSTVASWDRCWRSRKASGCSRVPVPAER